ncbi:acid-sensing ion channel 2-like isoform X1 [Haliotis rufescens]|uniref:acid-sensing ion channel 2-like isoform X1 n=1 Tax=Haliotis rufescens TaxID=6454 RepID=UPI00201E9898|nr:acid-sensing ion channel 2-like isoform X1 [Haliotis rufescens]
MVTLHDPRIHPDLVASSFLAAPGTSTYAVVQRSTYQYLPPPYQAFKNRTCVDTSSPSFNNTLQYFDIYTYENCLRECFALIAYHQCQCVSLGDDETMGKVCSIRDHVTCFQPIIVRSLMNATIHKSCGCQLPCSFEKYSVKVSSASYPSDVSVDMIMNETMSPDKEYVRNNYLEIKVFYEDLIVQSTVQTPQYTIETIMGNLGGQMGICLGASILTLTELAEFLIILGLTIFAKLRDRRQNVKRIHPTSP